MVSQHCLLMHVLPVAHRSPAVAMSAPCVPLFGMPALGADLTSSCQLFGSALLTPASKVLGDCNLPHCSLWPHSPSLHGSNVSACWGTSVICRCPEGRSWFLFALCCICEGGGGAKQCHLKKMCAHYDTCVYGKETLFGHSLCRCK